MRQDIYNTIDRRLKKYNHSKVNHTSCIRLKNRQEVYHLGALVAVVHIQRFNGLKVKRLELRNGFSLKSLHYYLHN